MLTFFRRTIVLCALLVGFVPTVTHGQPPASAQARLVSAVNDERVKAFRELTDSANPWVPGFLASAKERAERLAAHARSRDDLARSLIGLLERENAVVKGPAASSLGEAYHSDYYVNVVLTVGALRDARSVNALVGAVHSGNFATESVADLGEVAVPHLLRLLGMSDYYPDKVGALRALGKIASRSAEHSLASGTMQTIRRTLLSTLKDSEYGLRMFAVDALDTFNDGDIRAQIEVLAASDPATYTHEDGRIDYPVRRAAQGWLQRHPK